MLFCREVMFVRRQVMFAGREVMFAARKGIFAGREVMFAARKGIFAGREVMFDCRQAVFADSNGVLRAMEMRHAGMPQILSDRTLIGIRMAILFI